MCCLKCTNMPKNNFFITLIVLLAIFFACNQKNDRNPINTYLKDILNLNPKNNSLYIFAPSVSCKGCVSISLNEINEKVADDLISKIIFITTDTLLFPKTLLQKSKVILDTTHYMDRLDVNLPINNLTLYYIDSSGKDTIITSNIKNKTDFPSLIRNFLPKN